MQIALRASTTVQTVECQKWTGICVVLKAEVYSRSCSFQAPDFIFKMALRLLFVLAATRCAEASLRGNLHASAGSMSTDQLRETVLQEAGAW